MKSPSKTTQSNHAAAAAAIRAELKRRGIAGTVRAHSYSGGSSVNANVADLPPGVAAELDAFCGAYEYGSFDGSTDCYEYSNRREDLPQVKFVFVTNHISDQMSARIWDYCRSHYSLSVVDRAAYMPEMDCDGDTLIRRVFNGICGDFWNVSSATVEG